jgi:hypothetical protein
MEESIKRLIKELVDELPGDLNQFQHWVYFEDDICYVNLIADVYNGATFQVNSLSEELLPNSEKELEWYADKVKDFYAFVSNYIELVQSY